MIRTTMLTTLILVSLTLTAIAQQQSNGIFFEPEIPIPKNMAEATTLLKFFAENDGSHGLQPENCAEQLNSLYKSVYALSPDHFLGTDSGANNRTALQSEKSENPLQTIFLTRLALRQRFSQWVKEGAFSDYQQLQECGNALKVTTRTLRTFEDYYGQILLQDAGFFDEPEENQKTKKFESGKFPHSLLNPKYAEGHSFPHSMGDAHGSLKSGDILLSRGNAFTGAVISRIGSVDNQFSHLAIVYIADGSIKEFLNRDKEMEAFVPGQIYILESVLDNGLQVVTLDFYLKEDKARLAHFRYVGNGKQSDTELQEMRKLAAQKLAEKAATGKMPYNFSMDMNTDETLFCSQAVAYAYHLACSEMNQDCQTSPLAVSANTGHAYPFPVLSTVIEKEATGKYINQLADMLQLAGEKVFAPADVDMDPSIELVGEWRQYKNIAGRRIHDMVFTKVFQWMEEGGYKFKDSSPIVDDLSYVGQLLASSFEKMPPNTPEEFVKGTMLAAYLVESPGLNRIGKMIIGRLLESERVQELLNSIDDPDAARQFLKLSKLGIQSVSELDKPGLGTAGDLLDLATSSLQDAGVDQLDEEEVVRRMEYLRELVESGRLVDLLSFVGLNKEMKRFREGYVDKYGYPPTDYVYDRFLELHRVTACQKYQAEEGDFFHHLFAKDFSKDKTKNCDSKQLDWRNQW